MYLLDTNIVIYTLKGIRPVLAHLEAHRDDPMALSAATLMELYYGAYKSQKVRANLARIRAIEEAFEIIPVGPEIAETFGDLKAGLEREGLPLDDFDLILAATALCYNLTLVTNNVSHFGRIEGLKLENWAE
ncbi:PIN domain-containing protein [Thermodesulfatator atlanticus]